MSRNRGAAATDKWGMPLSSIRVSSAAQASVDRLLARASSAASASALEDALVRVAGSDGNAVLSAAEALATFDAFSGSGALTATEFAAGQSKTLDVATDRRVHADLDGITALFTLTGSSIQERMITELTASVARANGRPMEVDMLIFEFQSDMVEAAIARLARDNPNVTFRIIGDSGQAAASGGNALPSLQRLALENLQVKYKKDFPYIFDAATQRARYNHGATKGLNHHKGFVTRIDGAPDLLITGSFNWSETADTKNYEDLVIFRPTDSATVAAHEQLADEFAGFWNNADATLTANQLAAFKDERTNEMLGAHGLPLRPVRQPDNDVLPPYSPALNRSVDINAFDADALGDLLGAALARVITAEKKQFGRFVSREELFERVPAMVDVPAERSGLIRFGSGVVSVNSGSLEELDKVGFTRRQAEALIAWRELNGEFESLDGLGAAGISTSTIRRLSPLLTAADVDVFFNSRPYSAAAGGTGYGAAATRRAASMSADGRVTDVPANVTAAATDLFHRAQPGQEIRVAMYGMSVGAPEFVALESAARRGVKVRVVLNDSSTGPAVDALKALAAQGLEVDVRVQRAKTMHEKFGVVGDDVFFGSANFSSSSSTKHSENRLLIKNAPETADAFGARFESIWEKSPVR